MQIYAIDVSKEYLDIFSKSEDEKILQKRIKNNFKSIGKLLSELKDGDFICAEFTGVYTNLLLHLAHLYDVKMPWPQDLTLNIAWETGKENQISWMQKESGSMHCVLKTGWLLQPQMMRICRN